MPKQEKPRLGLYFYDKCVEPVDHWGTGKCRIGVVTIEEQDKIRNPGGLLCSETEAFRDLAFSCQYSRNDMGPKPYAWHLGYAQYMILYLRDIEHMYKLLKKAERIEKNLPVRPTTFGAWTCSIALGLGIRHFVLKTKDGGGGYDTCDFSITDLKYAAQHIDWKIDEYLKTLEPKPAHSA